GDELGIVAFGVRAYPVLELGPNPSEERLLEAVGRLQPTDPRTLLAEATALAGEWLLESKAPVRHAVIVTDGDDLDPGDVSRAQGAALDMAKGGVTVSVIQIASTRFGLASDVARIAELGRGEFVREVDGGAIPRLVFAE